MTARELAAMLLWALAAYAVVSACVLTGLLALAVLQGGAW